MAGMLKKLIATGALIGALMFTASVEAQSRITVKRNGKTYIVVTTRQGCETPRRHRATPRRVYHRCRHTRPQFRHWRHFHRFYNKRTHARHRCTYCIRYERWRNWRPCQYDPVLHTCRRPVRNRRR